MCVYVCVYVCVCMYVCDSATAKMDGWILMKFSSYDFADICKDRVCRIPRSEIDVVIAVIM